LVTKSKLGDYYSPLYAYFLGGLYTLFGDSYWVARLANVILGVGSIALIYLYTLRLFQSTGIALLTGLGACPYGPFLVFDTSGLKTTLGLFLTALALFLLSRSNHKERAIHWLYTGVVAGLAFNLSGQLGIFLSGICIWLFAKKTNKQSEPGNSIPWRPLFARLRDVSLLVLGILLSFAPFTIRNYYVAQDIVPVNSIGGIHFYIGNHKGAWGGYTKVNGIRPNPAGHFNDARRLAERETGQVMSASETSAFWRNKAFEFIKEKRGEFVSLLWKKTLLIFSAYEIPSNVNYQYLSQKSSFLSIFPGIGLLLPLGLCGILFSIPEYRKLAPLFIFFITYALGVILSFVTWRYRLPLTLALLPFAGFFIAKTGEFIRKKQFLLLITSVLLLFGFWLFTQASPVKDKHYKIDISRAKARMKMASEEQAILKKMESITPVQKSDYSRLLVRLAKLKRKQGAIKGSIKILQKALVLDPNQPRQWRTLSNMLRRLGHIEEAQKAKENSRKYKQRRSP